MRRLSDDGGRTRRVCLVTCLALGISACAAIPSTPPNALLEPAAGPVTRLGIVQQPEREPLRPDPWFATCNPCPEPTMKTPAGTVGERALNDELQASAPAMGVEHRDVDAPADKEALYTVHFGFDSDELGTSDAAAVRGLLPELEHRLVTVVGHTDATGPKAYNEDLALRRARAVERLLVSLGIPAVAIRVKGQGSCCYRASNDTASGRAENRRVEIFTSARTVPPPAASTSDSHD